MRTRTRPNPRFLSKPDMNKVLSIPFWTYARIQKFRDDADAFIVSKLSEKVDREVEGWRADGRSYIRIDGPVAKTSDAAKGTIYFSMDFLLLLSEPSEARSTECVAPNSILTHIYDQMIPYVGNTFEPIHDSVMVRQLGIPASRETLLYWKCDTYQ